MPARPLNRTANFTDTIVIRFSMSNKKKFPEGLSESPLRHGKKRRSRRKEETKGELPKVVVGDIISKMYNLGYIISERPFIKTKITTSKERRYLLIVKLTKGGQPEQKIALSLQDIEKIELLGDVVWHVALVRGSIKHDNPAMLCLYESEKQPDHKLEVEPRGFSLHPHEWAVLPGTE